MNREEFLLSLESQTIDTVVVEEVEKQYGFEIPEIVKKIISVLLKVCFLMMIGEHFL